MEGNAGWKRLVDNTFAFGKELGTDSRRVSISIGIKLKQAARRNAHRQAWCSWEYDAFMWSLDLAMDM